MYAIILSIVLVLYSFILMDFSLLFKDMNASADVIASTQAFYSAESAIEKSWNTLNELPESTLNELFLEEGAHQDGNRGDAFLLYNQGAESGYLGRMMTLFESDLAAASAFGEHQLSARSGAYRLQDSVLDQASIYGLQTQSSNRFVIREVEPEQNFNEVTFSYNQADEDSEVMFEIFAFPKEGDQLHFPRFETLKNGDQSSVKRIVINSQDPSQNGQSFDGIAQPLSVNFGSGEGGYHDQIRVSGFKPLTLNYILTFQTLDQEPVHYKLSAFHQGQPVMLPNVMQTVDVVGVSPGGVHQRIKVQKQTEFPLLPEFNFVHFSNERIDK